MQRDPEPTPASAPDRPLSLYEILAIVLLWNAGYKGARVANTLYALELGAGPFDTGLLLATYGCFPLLLAVFTGKIADRYGVRMPVVAGIVVSLLGTALPWFFPALPMLFVAAAVSGAGFILTQVSMQSLVGSLGSGAARTRNINLYALVVSTSDLLGPIIAGFSIDHIGHVLTYLVLAAPGAVAVLVVLVMFNRMSRAAGYSDRSGQRMADLLRIGHLRRMFLTSALVMTGLDLFQLYLPLHGHSIGLSASAIGAILGAFAAAGFVTRVLLTVLVRHLGEERTLCYSMYLAACTFFMIPLFDNAIVLGAVCFVLGLGMGLGQPLTVLLTYNYAPPGRHGEGLGLRIAINNSMHVAVPALFGAIGTVFGLAPVFWLSSVILALGGYTGPARKTA
jgi:MFS family permease